MLAARRGREFSRMPPTWLGKAATFAQCVFLVGLLARPNGLPGVFAVTVACSAAAAADYVRRFLRTRASWDDASPVPGDS